MPRTIRVLPFALRAGGLARRRYALTHPLGGANFTGILARVGPRKPIGHEVEWRGRMYPI